MSGQNQGSGPAAPDGFLTLSEAIERVAVGGRVTREKARYRLEREIADGRLRLLTRGGLEPIAAAPGLSIDWQASAAQVPGAMVNLSVVELPTGGESIRLTISDTPVVLDEDDIARLIAEMAPRPPAPMLAMPPQIVAPAASAAEKRRGGRPPEFDWEAVYRQLRRRIFRYGLPKNSAVLVREVLSLMGADPPEPRTIERRMAKWWPELEQLWEEISGPCEITPESNDRPF